MFEYFEWFTHCISSCNAHTHSNIRSVAHSRTNSHTDFYIATIEIFLQFSFHIILFYSSIAMWNEWSFPKLPIYRIRKHLAWHIQHSHSLCDRDRNWFPFFFDSVGYVRVSNVLFKLLFKPIVRLYYSVAICWAEEQTLRNQHVTFLACHHNIGTIHHCFSSSWWKYVYAILQKVEAKWFRRKHFVLFSSGASFFKHSREKLSLVLWSISITPCPRIFMMV